MPKLYVRHFDPAEEKIDDNYFCLIPELQKKSDDHIGFICSLNNAKDKVLNEVLYRENREDTLKPVAVLAISVSKEIYNTIMSKKRIVSDPKDSFYFDPQYCFYLPPEAFKVVAFFIQSTYFFFGEPRVTPRYIILNQCSNAFRIEKILEAKGIIHDLTKIPILSKEVSKVADFFKKYSLRQKFDLPHCVYLLAMLYDDLTSALYDPDKAFEYLQNCSDYFPAKKALLGKYIAASFDENGKIANPPAYALAQQTAETILAREPENDEAKSFLEREKTFVNSIKIAEEFSSIIGKPLKSSMFFKHFTKKMHLKMLEDAKATGDADYQHEFDKHYGLILKT